MARQDGAHRRITVLQDEVRQLHQAIASHTVVDQAIGVVIALGGLTPDQGWDVLKEVSQHTNTKLREIADQVVRWTNRGWLPDDTRQALDAALVRARDRGAGPGGAR
ncbi:ANTAR domain-containing protein [Streptomyces sp. SID8379]|uniref:ANTAR domain-containing protein n=1 Tax=unclassified Streptomyces TaxID=2593676 RepID=UPI00036AFB77|nr:MULTISPECIES: ANTAR domain-containing protein [unclassified Streptomyces]MYW63456.1 ANTAR domain-containing protein [Streptomyces sp. SID8379]